MALKQVGRSDSCRRSPPILAVSSISLSQPQGRRSSTAWTMSLRLKSASWLRWTSWAGQLWTRRTLALLMALHLSLHSIHLRSLELVTSPSSSTSTKTFSRRLSHGKNVQRCTRGRSRGGPGNPPASPRRVMGRQQTASATCIGRRRRPWRAFRSSEARPRTRRRWRCMRSEQDVRRFTTASARHQCISHTGVPRWKRTCCRKRRPTTMQRPRRFVTRASASRTAEV
mmetsp:Transcript_3293/g.5973  ORF Transcript_3293/g.5973 Transcript_3293/m.5973 type:complete len:227 (+) Transcript_3293:1462-2142(+)